MKHLAAAAIILHFSLCALHSPAASPAATESWVRNYVATARVARIAFDFTPVSLAVTNELDETEVVSLTFSLAECDALRVEDSNVAGMTNGTIFARNGAHAYANTANQACTAFAGAVEQYGSMKTGGRYQYVTNGAEVATNIVYDATNEVWMLRFVLDVGGEIYTSTEVCEGYHACRSASDPSRSFRLRGCKISAAQRDALLTPRARFRLLDLLFPSAYAVAPGGEKEYYDKYRDGDYVILKYRQHYVTEAVDAVRIDVGLIVYNTVNGNTVERDLSVPIVEVFQGTDLCDLKGFAADDDRIVDEITEALGTNRAKQFFKSGEAMAALTARLDDAERYMAETFGNYSCPGEGEESVYDPEDPPPHVCSDFTGHCGMWICPYCKKIYESIEDDPDHPADHDFQITEEGGSCAVCVHCGARPEDEEQHHGWRDAVTASGAGRIAVETHVCACACGKFVLFHQPKARTVRFVEDLRNPNTCWEVWECLRCGEVVEPYSYDSVDSLHDGGYTISAGGHNETHNGKYTAVTVENPHTGEAVDVCRCTYTCRHFRNLVDLGCGAVRTEDFEHLPKEEAALATRPLDETYHEIAVPCGNGFISWNNTTNWCGYTFYTNEEHRIGFSEVLPWDDPDYPATRTHHAFLKVCGHRNMAEELKIDPRNHECGMEIVTNQPHAFIGAPSYGDPDATTHAVSNYCHKCNGLFLASPDGREPHVPAKGATTYFYVDMDGHIASNVCDRCAAPYVAGTGMEPHESEYRDGEIVRACAYFSETTHIVSNYCRKCESWFFAGTEAHVPMYESPAPEDEYVRCKALPDWRHETSVPCAYCMKPTTNGLEYVWMLLGTNECTKAWTLSIETNENDVVRCAFDRHGCDNIMSTNHAWNAENELFHWCMNGGGHLHEGHVYPEYVAGAKCTVCGREYEPPPPTCDHCGCSSRTCDSWDSEAQGCGCNHCENMRDGNDDGELCSCSTCSSVAVDGVTYFLHKGAAGLRSAGGWAEVMSFAEQNSAAEGDIEIPDYVEKDGVGYTVTKIDGGDYSGYREDSRITSVSAGQSLKTIEDRAFGGHFQLASASFPGATSVGENAFYRCTSLTNAALPSLTELRSLVFEDCTSLETISLPAAQSVDLGAFYGCSSLTNIVVPAATSIGSEEAGDTVIAGGRLHLHLGQSSVTCAPSYDNFAAIHFPSNKTLNGVAYPAQSVYFGGGYVPIVWEAAAQ